MIGTDSAGDRAIQAALKQQQHSAHDDSLNDSFAANMFSWIQSTASSTTNSEVQAGAPMAAYMLNNEVVSLARDHCHNSNDPQSFRHHHSSHHQQPHQQLQHIHNNHHHHPNIHHDQQQQPHHDPTSQITDAATYIRLVQNRTLHEPETFQQFLELLRAFREEGETRLRQTSTDQKSRSDGTEDGIRVIAERVVALLHPYPDLVLGFNQFLPDGYVIGIHPHYLNQPNGYQPSVDDPPPYIIMRQPTAQQNNIMDQQQAVFWMDPSFGQLASNVDQMIQYPNLPFDSMSGNLTLEEALGFLHHVQCRVEQYGRPELYPQFKDVIRKHRSQEVKVSDVAKAAQDLFGKDFPDLLIAFNRFLPKQYWNSVDLNNWLPDATDMPQNNNHHQQSYSYGHHNDIESNADDHNDHAHHIHALPSPIPTPPLVSHDDGSNNSHATTGNGADAATTLLSLVGTSSKNSHEQDSISADEKEELKDV